jgi:hypothetical protein
MGKDRNEAAKPAARRRVWAAGKRKDGQGELAELGDLGGTVDRILATGDALMFSRTSDGGAIAITLFTDGGKEKVYSASQEELDANWQALGQAYPDVAR